MTNNKAAYDDITAELLKYASPEIHTEISEALNEIFSEHADIEIGAGKIAAIEKPKKPMPGPVKDLRPITHNHTWIATYHLHNLHIEMGVVRPTLFGL